jgi:hypothetical protein
MDQHQLLRKLETLEANDLLIFLYPVRSLGLMWDALLLVLSSGGS